MANGKQAKSVQVAEWMGRREAWSAEKPTDPRTKPTRWEFHNGREQFNENVGIHETVKSGEDRHRIRSAEEQQRRVKIKNSSTAKDDTFHNSRTNLINDRDIYIEDIADERELLDTDTEHFQSNKTKQQLAQHQQDNGIEAKHSNHDSLNRHEMDRGSDMNYNTARSSLKNKREFFIKDGNIEILQLMTRDKTRDSVAVVDDDNNVYVNLPVKSTNLSEPQVLMVDNSGKEILMRRFIEEQPDGKQIIREHYQIVPGATYIQAMPNEIQPHSTMKGGSIAVGKSGVNSIVYSQTEPEVKVIHTQPVHGAITIQPDDLVGQMHLSTSNQSLTNELENSLKQQNALLRQILMEKEKLETRYTQQEVVLETQSLPGQYVAIATQTECEAGTQTNEDVEFAQKTTVNMQGKSMRRKARSENDDSMSENEYEFVRFSPPNSPEHVYWIKRKKQKKRSKYRSSTHPRKRIIMVEDVKRKIRTPIKEEDDEMYEYRKRTPPKKPLRRHAETKTSVLRRKKNEEMKRKDIAMGQKVTEVGREVVIEVSDSLDEKTRSPDVYRTRIVDEISYYPQNNACTGDVDDDYDDDNELEYSNESDADEIVIKSNAFTPNQNKHKNYSRAEAIAEKSNNGTFSRSSSDQREKLPEVKSRNTRKTNSQRLNRSKSSSEPAHSRYYTEKQKSSSLNIINSTYTETPEAGNAAKDRVYQSETDLNYQDDRFNDTDIIEKGVPKYMEWYYGKQKTTNNRAGTDSLKSLTVSKKKNSVSEKRLSKTRLYSKPDAIISDEAKSKPEPAPRKSPPKNNRLLKEDIVMNKQHNPKIETDTSHPLLQHSEHRFERENAPEVPLPPTKLPHYMYPETPPFAAFKESPGNNIKVKPKPSPIRENEVKVTNSKISLNVGNPNSAIATSSTNTQKQLNASTLEDDHDSGIAMNSLLNSMGRRNPIADKKSVFSIAYDDVSRVRKIASGGESPQYS